MTGKGQRYAAAFAITLLAVAIVALVDRSLSFPPFLLFAMAAGINLICFGGGPGLLSVAVGTLASDFLFMTPRHELSLDLATATLAVIYSVGAALCRAAARWSSGGDTPAN